MLQLQPKQIFTVVRQLADPLDTDTYYVRAVIKKSSDGSVLETINLTDNGDQRFTGTWQVKEDPSGEGYLIDVTVTVYTDSGYTTKSPNYSIENLTYLVQERWNPYLGGSGGGGSDLTQKQVRKIIKEEVKKIKIPEQQKVDLSNISKNIDDILQMFIDLKIPEPEKLDLTNVLTALNRVNSEIKQEIKNIPPPPKVDLNPIIEANKKDNEQLSKDIKTMTNYLIEMFKGNAKKLESFIMEAKNRFDISDKLRGVFDGVKGNIRPFQNEEAEMNPRANRIRTK